MADVFIEIDGIKGDSQDEKHKQWIEVLSYSHSVAQMGGGSASAAGTHTGGRADVSEFSITKMLDSASPVLNQHCCTGKHIVNIKVELCRAMGDKTVFMEYILKDSMVSSVSCSGSSGGEDLPVEQVSFRFGEILWTYTPTDPTGGGKKQAGIKAGWSTLQNKPV